MRLVIQTVESAILSVDNTIKASIQNGAIVYVGFHHDDTAETVKKMVDKLLILRIYPDEMGKTNRSLQDFQGSLLLVPNFTLYADVSSSRRPSFTDALPPLMAEAMFRSMIDYAASLYLHIYHGVFGADMHLDVTHQGPFTMVLES